MPNQYLLIKDLPDDYVPKKSEISYKDFIEKIGNHFESSLHDFESDHNFEPILHKMEEDAKQKSPKLHWELISYKAKKKIIEDLFGERF